MKIIIKRSALRDIQEIFEWYEKETEGLGEIFLDDFQKTLPYLVMYSRSFRVRFKKFRIIPLDKFPYQIYFRISGQSIIIQKVGHQSRNKRKLRF